MITTTNAATAPDTATGAMSPRLPSLIALKMTARMPKKAKDAKNTEKLDKAITQSAKAKDAKNTEKLDKAITQSAKATKRPRQETRQEARDTAKKLAKAIKKTLTKPDNFMLPDLKELTFAWCTQENLGVCQRDAETGDIKKNKNREPFISIWFAFLRHMEQHLFPKMKKTVKKTAEGGAEHMKCPPITPTHTRFHYPSDEEEEMLQKHTHFHYSSDDEEEQVADLQMADEAKTKMTVLEFSALAGQHYRWMKEHHASEFKEFEQHVKDHIMAAIADGWKPGLGIKATKKANKDLADAVADAVWVSGEEFNRLRQQRQADVEMKESQDDRPAVAGKSISMQDRRNADSSNEGYNSGSSSSGSSLSDESDKEDEDSA
jgi:hypothetical protein